MERRPRAVAWQAAAAMLLLAAIFCLVRWTASSPEPAVGGAPHSKVTPSSSEGQVGSSEGVPSSALPALPVEISIPAINVSSRLVGLGLNPDGTVEVPANAALAGWYRLGTRPGALGSAVILGHVDSPKGPAVFYLLSTLDRGDVIDVATADGGSQRFRVRSVRTYPNAQFPARRVYAPRGDRALNLVTCGGAFVAALGGYQANVVVYAQWVRRH